MLEAQLNPFLELSSLGDIRESIYLILTDGYIVLNAYWIPKGMKKMCDNNLKRMEVVRS